MPEQLEDVLLVNGTVVTALPAGADAGTLLIRGGRVAAVGGGGLSGPAPKVIDLQGGFVLPGFVDAHCHLIMHGEARLRWVDLLGTDSLEELQARLRQRMAVRPPVPGEWLVGRGFDQDRLAGARMPTAADLDAVSSEVPIAIERVCAHAMVVNHRAQALAGIQAPDGFVAEDDMAPVWAALPPPSAADKLAAAELACREAAAAGFTGAHCILSRREDIVAVRDLARRGALPIRLRLLAPSLELLDPPEGCETPPCRTLKLFADGSLGAHTAALSAPYADMPETAGRMLYTPAALRERVGDAHRRGYQVAVHAIGDAAIGAAIEAIAAAQAELPRPGARHRIEHASVLPPRLARQIIALGIIAVVQPQFAVSDFWTGARLGPARAGWAYPFRSLLDGGALLAGGTDCPVERLDPFEAVARAVSREPAEQRITAAEAMALFTAGAAYAGGDENECGRLQPGYRADLIVVANDPRKLPADAIAALRPELMLVGGRVVHAAGRFSGMA